MKNTLTPLASGFLAVILLISGCSKAPDRAIEDVLNRCARISEQISGSNMSPAQAANHLAEEMQGMDTRDCPPEFRRAFQSHINAWRQAAPYFSENTGANAFLEGFVSGVFGDPSMYGISQRNAEMATWQINQTYNELVDIAAYYGARVPRSVIE